MPTTVQDVLDLLEEKDKDPEDVEIWVGEFNHRFAESIDSDPIEDVQDVDDAPYGPSLKEGCGSMNRDRLLFVQYK